MEAAQFFREPRGGSAHARKFLSPNLNSLFLDKNSLLRVWKFPVPLHREFSWKPLTSLADWAPKSQCRARIRRNSLYFSLLAGNLTAVLIELVSSILSHAVGLSASLFSLGGWRVSPRHAGSMVKGQR